MSDCQAFKSDASPLRRHSPHYLQNCSLLHSLTVSQQQARSPALLPAGQNPSPCPPALLLQLFTAPPSMLLHFQQPRSQGSMAPRAVLAALWLVAAAHLLSGAAAIKPLSPFDSGILTHYGGAQDGMDPSSPSFGSKEGACGYGAIPKDRWPYYSVAALSTSSKFYKEGPLNGCGQCFQISCTGGMDDFHKDACIKDSKGRPKSILVMISDQCPECGADHIDVQSLSFAKLANPGIGRIKINYRRIECTPPDDMKVSVMDFVGSNGWLRLAIDDTGGRGSVETVYVKGSGSGSWIPMKNTWGATWELSMAPVPPLDFKITTDDGEEVVATDVIKQNGGISAGPNNNGPKFSTGVQFSITDPAVLQVHAMSGEEDPMVATSDTPGNGDVAGGSSGDSISLSAPSPNSSPNPSSPNSSPAFSSPNASPSPAPNSPNSSPSPNPSSPNPSATFSSPNASPSPAPNSPNSSPSPSSSSSGSSGGCQDVAPPGDHGCNEWKDWGKCTEVWLVSNNYCAATCGRCGSSAQAGVSGDPKVQSFSGPPDSSAPSPSGRKLLRRLL